MARLMQAKVPRVVEAYTHGMHRLRWVIVGLWLVTGIFFAIFAMSMIGRTSQAFVPPSGTQADRAAKAMERLWPESAKASQLVLYVGARQEVNRSAILPLVPHNIAMEELTTSVASFCQGVSPPILTTNGVMGYYTLPAEYRNLSLVSTFVGTDGRSSIITIEITPYFVDERARRFAKNLTNFVDSPAFDKLRNQGYFIQLSGVPAFIDTMIDSVEMDLLTMDAIVLPLAMLVLAYIVRSLRLMLLPCISIGLTLGVSFGMMYFIAGVMSVNTVAPSLMMSVIIAMTIDYNLFTLTRYTEELRKGNRGVEGMAIVINSAGRTILVSGVTLCCCFLGLLSFKMDMLSSLGVGCALSIILALLVNLVLVPTLLLCFPTFFEKSVDPLVLPRWWQGNPCLSWIMASDEEGEAHELAAMVPVKPVAGGACVVVEEDLKRDTPVYYFLGKLIQKWPWHMVIIAVSACVLIPFGMHAFNFKVNDSMEDYMPRGSAMRTGFMDMVTSFGYGMVYPYEVILEPPSGTDFVGEEFFNVSQQFYNSFATWPGLPSTVPRNFQFYTYPGGANQTYADFKSCMTGGATADICMEVMFMYTSAVNDMRSPTAAMGHIILDIDPIGDDGRSWYLTAVDFCDDWNAAHPGWHAYITGIAGDSMDMINSVYDLFPTMIAVTGAMVLVLVALAFRSVFVPLRAIVSIGATLIFVFGFAVMTYQHGALDFFHWASLGHTGALSWSCPIVSFAIIIGVALDYDVFLLSRIAEYGDAGYTTPDAILLGLCRTGGIITAAGVIMAIAFSGLLFSHTMVMNQLSFFMVFSVLFDTFVMRTLLAPSLMVILGKYNWWPFLKRGDTASTGPVDGTDDAFADDKF